MKKAFPSLSQMTGFGSGRRGHPQPQESKPITDFITSTKSRHDARRKESNTSPGVKRASHVDLFRLLGNRDGKKAETNTRSKRSSTTDLYSLKSSKPSHNNLKGHGLKSSSRASSNNLKGHSHTHRQKLPESDMDDIFKMVTKLKRSSQGQKVLSQFVDYQTGKTTRKPKMLEGIDTDEQEDERVGYRLPNEIIIT